MSSDEAARLASAELTYSPVGATRTSTYPEGFHRLEHTAELGTGDDALEVARDRLMTWRMHLDAGLRVTASRPRVAEGAVVRYGLGPLRIPCRVVWVHEEPDSCGFAYGTLPGHPESGEESFLLMRNEGRLRFVISAYSRPGRLSTRLAGPLGRSFQRVMARRYATALEAGGEH